MRKEIKVFLEVNYPKCLIDNNLSLTLSCLEWLSSAIASDYSLEPLKLDIFSECFMGLRIGLSKYPKSMWDMALLLGERYCIKEKQSQTVDIDRVPEDYKMHTPKFVRYNHIKSMIYGLVRR